MNIKEKIENYKSEVKKITGRLSTMNFIRKNFEDFCDLIAEMRNQGQGCAYEKIAEFCYQEGIKTKDNKQLSVAYIKDCLIKIRKEKGLKVRGKKRKPKIKEIIKEVINEIEVIKEVDNKQFQTLQNDLIAYKKVFSRIQVEKDLLEKQNKELNSLIDNKNYEIKRLKEKIEILEEE
jgi:hypothetical protein